MKAITIMKIDNYIYSHHSVPTLYQILNYAEPPFCRALRDADLMLVQFSLIGQLKVQHVKENANVFGCSAFVNIMLHRFGIFDYLGFEKAPDVNKEQYWNEVKKGKLSTEKDFSLPWSNSECSEVSPFQSLLEDFLYTMIILITELPPPPAKNKYDQLCQAKKNLRREVIHRLVSGPKTHSELAEVYHVLPHRDSVSINVNSRACQPFCFLTR